MSVFYFTCDRGLMCAVLCCLRGDCIATTSAEAGSKAQPNALPVYLCYYRVKCNQTDLLTYLRRLGNGLYDGGGGRPDAGPCS